MPRELSLAEVFQLGYYWETKILLTAVQMDVFSAMGAGPSSAETISRSLGTNSRATELLLNALVAMRLLKKDDASFTNTATAGRYLRKSSSEYIGHLLTLQDAEWEQWGKLPDVVRTGRSPVRGHMFETHPELGAQVLSVLHRIGQQAAPELARRLRLQGATEFLDLGGGAGTHAIAFCQVYPELRATVFDLPPTLRTAERTVHEAGLSSRIRLQAGDFRKDPLGGPYDLVLMSDVLHYQGPEANAAVVQKAFTSIRPGGRLVIKDRFLDPSGTAPPWTAAFAVHILLNTEEGRCYTVPQAASWMRNSGFEEITELERSAVVQGTKPRGDR